MINTSPAGRRAAPLRAKPVCVDGEAVVVSRLLRRSAVQCRPSRLILPHKTLVSFRRWQRRDQRGGTSCASSKPLRSNSHNSFDTLERRNNKVDTLAYRVVFGSHKGNNWAETILVARKFHQDNLGHCVKSTVCFLYSLRTFFS